MQQKKRATLVRIARWKPEKFSDYFKGTVFSMLQMRSTTLLE